jgi:hypothetical protein
MLTERIVVGRGKLYLNGLSGYIERYAILFIRSLLIDWIPIIKIFFA